MAWGPQAINHSVVARYLRNPGTTTAALLQKARRGRKCTHLEVQGAFVPENNEREATNGAQPIDDKITDGHVSPRSQNSLWGSSGIQRGMAFYRV